MGSEWEIACSDEENYDLHLGDSGKWEPVPEDIVNLYERLERGEMFDLSWKCPGRRPPTPEKQDEPQLESKTDELKPLEKDEYLDFDIDKGQIKLRPSGDIGPRGSAKKKTTSLDAIISNMERHRRMDMMEDDPPE